MSRLINQEANYAGSFGAVFRSSAIFFKPTGIKTTISFSNYWKFKNGLNVGIVITLRNIKGKLISREEVSFQESNVINYEVGGIEQGSVEVEAFSSDNLRIPYAAIMVIYESKSGVSMVHSYGRNHSLIELEDDNAIVEARESCWTLRVDEKTTNKAVFHNGHLEIEPQEAVFVVTRFDGFEKRIEFTLPKIDKFETVVFHAEELLPSIKDFLGEKDGWGTLHFNSNSSFTRLLIIWENAHTGEVQVTHSNFDYSSHRTNMVESEKPAFMVLPSVYGEVPNAIVYPKFSKGSYTVNDGSYSFSGGVVIKGAEKRLAFQRKDGQLPARIVTAASGKLNEDVSIPFECSLGVVHEKRPPKRFHWLVISKMLPTVIHLTAYKEIYPCTEGVELVLKLYSDKSNEVVEKSLSFPTIDELPQELEIEEIFDLSGIDSFGYVSIFSHYGGLFFYSSFRKGNSLTLEHSF